MAAPQQREIEFNTLLMEEDAQCAQRICRFIDSWETELPDGNDHTVMVFELCGKTLGVLHVRVALRGECRPLRHWWQGT